MFSNFFSENLAIYNVMSKDTVQTEAADGKMAAQCMLG
jgi:hypothetical protein